jgi:hypothetical protein
MLNIFSSSFSSFSDDIARGSLSFQDSVKKLKQRRKRKTARRRSINFAGLLFDNITINAFSILIA